MGWCSESYDCLRSALNPASVNKIKALALKFCESHGKIPPCPVLASGVFSVSPPCDNPVHRKNRTLRRFAAPLPTQPVLNFIDDPYQSSTTLFRFQHVAHERGANDGWLRLTNIHAGLRVGRVQTVCISFSHYDILMLRQSAFAADRKGVCTRLA